jgi:hypothetical protein
MQTPQEESQILHTGTLRQVCNNQLTHGPSPAPEKLTHPLQRSSMLLLLMFFRNCSKGALLPQHLPTTAAAAAAPAPAPATATTTGSVTLQHPVQRSMRKSDQQMRIPPEELLLVLLP